MKSKILSKISKISNNHYIFIVTLIFYITLFFVNPSNKIIVLFFFILFFIYYIKIRNYTESLLFTLFASSILLTGKTYPIQLAPSGVFLKDIYPNGYITNIVVSVSNITAFIMLVTVIRNLLINKKRGIIYKFHKLDLLICIFYFLKLLSALLGSKNPAISFPIEILSLTDIIAYFFIRTSIDQPKKVLQKIAYLFASLVIFESFLGFLQLSSHSPLGKNLEYQLNIEYFGHSPDETAFSFRPVGTFNHANALGIWLSATCILLIAVFLNNSSSLILASILSGIALLISTMSRSAWLGFTFSMIYIVYYSINYYSKKILKIWKLFLKARFIIVPLFLLLLLFFVIPRLENSVYSFSQDAGATLFRSLQNKDTLLLIKIHPIFGIGSGMGISEGIVLNLFTKKALLPLEPHNWYLLTALNNGVLSIMTFIIFIFVFIKNLMKIKSQNIFVLSGISIIISTLIAAILQPFYNMTLVLMLTSLAINDNMSTYDNK